MHLCFDNFWWIEKVGWCPAIFFHQPPNGFVWSAEKHVANNRNEIQSNFNFPYWYSYQCRLPVVGEQIIWFPSASPATGCDWNTIPLHLHGDRRLGSIGFVHLDKLEGKWWHRQHAYCLLHGIKWNFFSVFVWEFGGGTVPFHLRLDQYSLVYFLIFFFCGSWRKLMF